MSEYREIMGIIRQYADEDAQIKFGTAEVEDMPEDTIRVTLIATGLGQQKPVRRASGIHQDRQDRHRRPCRRSDQLRRFRYPGHHASGRRRAAPSTDFSNPEVSDSYDIPAFLRKQAD
jgi:cell division protein FtsZ